MMYSKGFKHETKGKLARKILRSRWKLWVWEHVTLKEGSIYEETEQDEKRWKMDGKAWLLDIPH
jgi:hypothetical protein